jgi:hypothetical protein
MKYVKIVGVYHEAWSTLVIHVHVVCGKDTIDRNDVLITGLELFMV